MIKYKCPKCGLEVTHYMGASYPPTPVFICNNKDCDYSHYGKRQPLPEDEIRIAPMAKTKEAR